MKIGVDGGGTKTELILINQSGEIVARHLTSGCNPSHVGTDRAREIITGALDALLSTSKIDIQRSGISHTLLCMAGSPDFWREFAASLTGNGEVEATTDASPVLELATGGRPGLVLHAGTGSFVALRAPDGNIHYVGGLGWRLGDPGSAHDIGRRAISRALAELQGWANKSNLGPELCRAFATDNPSAITSALHREAEPNKIIGSFATRVSELAISGDTTARDIILGSCSELLACAEAAAATFFRAQSLDTLPAGLSGPILTQRLISEALQARSPLALKPLTESPIEGVRRLLIRKH